MMRPTHNASGFTLLELLLASAMVAVLAGALYGTLHIAFNARNSATSAVEGIRKAGQTMEIIQADIQASLILSGTLAPDFVGTSGGSMVGGAYDSLAFYSAVAQGELGPSVGDVKKIDYFCQTGNDGQLSLTRGVTTNLLAPITQESTDEVICRNIRSFTMRYYDGTNWQENWDSTTLSDALPVAIEVNIEFAPTGGSDGGGGNGTDGQSYKCSRVMLVPLGLASSGT
jgi:general secretion pathway protein J